MERFRDYAPNQNQFFAFDPGQQFPVGTFERFLVDTLDAIDIPASGEEDLGGETPYHPKALLGIILLGYAKGVFSSRKMERECRTNLSFMYVSGFNAPDHATISRFVASQDELMRMVFSRVLFIADECGYLDYRLIATDGTKIKANAASKFSGTLEMFESRRKRLEKKIELAIEKQRATDKKIEKEYWAKKETRYRKERAKISDFLKTAEVKEKHDGKETQQNITDPECRRMKIGMEVAESYNGQASACGKNGIIVAADVSNETNDYRLFSDSVDRLDSGMAELGKDSKRTKYLFDNGYYTADNLALAAERDLDVYIADSRDHRIYLERKKPRKESFITVDDCTLRKYKDFYSVTCPGGIRLTRYAIRTSRGRQFYTFPVPGRGREKEICAACTLRAQCRGKNSYSHQKSFSYRKEYLDNKSFIEKHSKKLRSERGRRIYSRRMPTIERVFGHIKGNMGLWRFQRRGLKKVRNEWQIACTAHNLRRMFTLSGQR